MPEFRMYTCSEPAQPYVAVELVTLRESGAGEGRVRAKRGDYKRRPRDE